MGNDSAEYLRRRFTKYAGKESTDQLPYFLLAYSTFRDAYCQMAAHATQDSAEQVRLEQWSQFYRRKMQGVIDSSPSMLRV